MTTSHEPAYPEDGIPKDRHRVYHEERAKAGVLDGIELQVYGHSLDQFWSPLTNDLVGPYGADTLDNRMRFPLDVLSAFRNRVRKEFIIGFRYTADEAQKGGITEAEGIEISKSLRRVANWIFSTSYVGAFILILP